LSAPDVELPIDPYALGYWLGNGDSRSAKVWGHLADVDEFLEAVDCRNVHRDDTGVLRFDAVADVLKPARRLCPDKTVPEIYLRASPRQRLLLLQGLMDSDGHHMAASNHVEFCNTREHLADAVVYLARSLGQKPVKAYGRAKLYGKDCGPKWRVCWTPTVSPFRMQRKASRRNVRAQALRNHHRMIVSVERTGRKVWMRCLTVDSRNSMYLVGDSMIPTHNTRCGAEWVRSCVCGDTPLAAGAYHRIALVAETAADGRDVLVEGDSGLLRVHPKDFRPLYESSKRRLTWPNGATATVFNATEPDALRGPQFDLAWADELAKWQYAQQSWDMLQFGLRLGEHPRQIVTTTPRPIPIIKALLRDPNCVVTRGSTFDNASNLAAPFLQRIRERYEGTRLGRQELNAEILDDVPGALWTRANLDEHRIGLGKNGKRPKLPDMQRVVVGVDPAVAAAKDSGSEDGGGLAETGIVVVGLGVDGRAYVLDDCTARLSPRGWARRAIAAYDYHKADCIIAEVNQGGAMVEAVLRSERSTIPVISVHASRGKVTRAEPIAALYEQGRVSHVGSFPELEDQMVLVTPFGVTGGGLMDRCDALAWAISHLFPSIVHHVKDDEPLVYENLIGRSSISGY
jgi:predicted phage terminase large subunit-like protein